MSNDNVDTNLYPPLASEELKNAHAYENLDRVVVTQHGVWGRSAGGGWIRLQPLAELEARKK